jgi:hypothetical protein
MNWKIAVSFMLAGTVNASAETNIDAALKNMKDVYNQASAAAANTLKLTHAPVATACFDMVIDEWEKAYFRLMAGDSSLQLNLIQAQLDDYGQFMAQRLRDAELREYVVPGALDVIRVEVRTSRSTSNWPTGPGQVAFTYQNAQIDLLAKNLAGCMNTSFLSMVSRKLPEPNLGGELEAKAKYYRVTFQTPQRGGGIVAVVESREQPYAP